MSTKRHSNETEPDFIMADVARGRVGFDVVLLGLLSSPCPCKATIAAGRMQELIRISPSPAYSKQA